jgi:peptide/nickel transport system ATP-binding protein
MSVLLEARNATKEYAVGGGLFGHKAFAALEDFGLAIHSERPTITAIAGESGSGKTTLARLLLGVIQPTRGEIRYKDKPLDRMSKEEWRAYRREVQAIFQDPFEVYNPFYRVDHALIEPITHFKLARTAEERNQLIEKALRSVGLRPEETLGRYPHQLSGGQRQRVMIARALLLQPRIILADEPVSMVDASLRATILESLLKLKQERNISLLYITHDLTTAYQLSENIVILYQGRVAEVGDVERVIKDPKHPYTRLLVDSIPLPDPDAGWGKTGQAVRKAEERRSGPQSGCRFANRCPAVMDVCWKERPPVFGTAAGQGAACWLYRDAPVTDPAKVLGRIGIDEAVEQAKGEPSASRT